MSWDFLLNDSNHCLIHRGLACCSIFSDQTHVTRYASEPVSIGESTPSKKLISDTALTLLFALSAFGFMCALCGGDLRNPANRSTRHHNHTPGRTHQPLPSLCSCCVALRTSKNRRSLDQHVFSRYNSVHMSDVRSLSLLFLTYDCVAPVCK